MKKTLLLSFLFLGLLAFTLKAHSMSCGWGYEYGKVLVDADCPLRPGQIFKYCSDEPYKCCNPDSTYACPDVE